MLRGYLLLALLCIATNAGAVAFAEVRITHITKGTYLLSDPANQTITSSVDTDEVLASVTAGPAPNVQVDRQVNFDLTGTPAGTVKFIEMTYVLTAWDDGLVASGPLSSWCSPSSPHFSTPPFCVESLDGYEVAGADLFIWYVAPGQVLPPGQFFSPAVISLQTNDDAIADRFTVSGIARAEANSPFAGAFLNNGVTAFGDGSAVALVPEPETWTMLLGGLGLLALTRRRRPVLMH